jgi:ribosomal protein L3 glutamine methyltransferase
MLPNKPAMITPLAETAAEDLFTARDWLRYAVSRFEAAGLVYGHGTTGPVDEAAFLILKTLHLPIDSLDPWLDCRLTKFERGQVAAIIETRISSRKPACYLVNEAWIQGLSFYVDERVIVPRSYIGELLRDGLSAVVPDAGEIERALDLCTGSGCLAILAARAFPNAEIDAVDISDDALEVARQNVGDYDLNDRIAVIASDVFMGVKGQRYDLILSNPPYVSDEAVADFPPEHRAEPVIAHAGGKDGLDIVRRILNEARQHLTESGMLVVEMGTGRDILEAEYPKLPFLWLDTENSEGEVFALPASALPG